MRDHVVIYLNGQKVKIGGAAAFATVAEFLRYERRLVGTKIGCAEGDCGACTVLVGVPHGKSLTYSTAPACIQGVYQLDGTHLVTVEGIGSVRELSPVQQAMVDHHGSQCGFCTPGFIMALTGAFEAERSLDENFVRSGLSGNLCRCTGYLPILESALAVDRDAFRPLSSRYDSEAMVGELSAATNEPVWLEAESTIWHRREVFYRPNRLADALAFKSQNPGAVVLAGGTEVGLQRNLAGSGPAMMLSLRGIGELSQFERAAGRLRLGANITWAQLDELAKTEVPALLDLTQSFASPAIRNVATFVGNVAHGSSVADSLCLLMVSDAQVDLASLRGCRSVPIDAFYRGAKRSVIEPDELITGISFDIPEKNELMKLYKVTKRREMDISTFRAAIRIERQDDSIASARLAYSGFGPVARRLEHTEAFLVGKPLSEAIFREAGQHAHQEAIAGAGGRSAQGFRMQLAENILIKFYHEVIEPIGQEVGLSHGRALQSNGQGGEVDSKAVAFPTAIGQPLPHEAARAHVTGTAAYIDDLVPYSNELLVDYVGSPLAHARILSVDVTKALAIPGIVCALSAAEVPGAKRFGPVFQDEDLLAESECSYFGQPVVVLAGTDRAALRAAQKAVRLELEELPAILSMDDAIVAESFIGSSRRIARGHAEEAIAGAEHVLYGALRAGGQDHFYLETQAALAVPGELGQILIHSSTQNPSEVQAIVAHCLGLPLNQVVCVCNRMGGGFGGKESQAAQPAALAALVAHWTGRPARFVYSRRQDMQTTGKRHPMLSRYRVGFTSAGEIRGLVFEIFSDGGCSADLSLGVMERAMLHADNAYYLPHVSISGTVCRTNHPSNTAMRGFGAPQGIVAIENVIEDIAAFLGLDALDVRRRNCYAGEGRNIAPYGQIVRDRRLRDLFDQLATSADYDCRRQEIARFNSLSRTHLRGLALTPVKFGISFTRRTLNQANALVNIYLDGTVQVSTGGTEMGQGLHRKIQQLVAGEFSLPVAAVRVMPTSTEKNNNTSPTAASASTDLNGSAAVQACILLKQRLIEFAARHFASPDDGLEASPAHIHFEAGSVCDTRRPGASLTFEALVRLAYEARIDLGARGFYATPGVDFNRETGRGNPFLYYTNGCAASEVLIDRLTGELRVERVDLLIDLGEPINPAIDRGQVIGGFVQGMGWVTTEELRYGPSGELVSDCPNNYKIPSVECLPRDFRVEFLRSSHNLMVPFGSKAVGEPPLVLAISVWAAVKQALANLTPGRPVHLNLPATSEEILGYLYAAAEPTAVAR